MVTIIMPAYNAEKYISEAIESVLAQTYDDWELLVINDCSTDNTQLIAENYARIDNRVRILNNEVNKGVAGTRNVGIDNATTEWVAFLDSDDMWSADKLEKQLAFIENHSEAKLVFTASAFISEEGQSIDYILHVPERINRKELLKQNLISCSSTMIKRELLVENPMPEARSIHEDYATWLRILETEPYAYGIDEPLLIYRLSAASKSGNKLKAAGMNCRTYKKVGLKPFEAAYYMFIYAVRSIKKYSKLS